ncbi:uncharacterized protein K441DRAFT_48103 [Cenococcum geophilum 1.58]|uniref:uncharacterized protein n=1 Tax=Cenococcum geophilum 1.58 TaxID=794803 RepID=UPI00358EC640|nr:hypothetical protein K441DRAFT_48103 [Cenococcum geophilum 1.58]
MPYALLFWMSTNCCGHLHPHPQSANPCVHYGKKTRTHVCSASMSNRRLRIWKEQCSYLPRQNPSWVWRSCLNEGAKCWKGVEPNARRGQAARMKLGTCGQGPEASALSKRSAYSNGVSHDD